MRPWIGKVLSPRAWIGEGLYLRAWTGAGPSFSRPGLGRDHLSWRRDYLSLGWDNVIMDVLSLKPGYLSMCLTLRAGSVHVTRGIFLLNVSPSRMC